MKNWTVWQSYTTFALKALIHVAVTFLQRMKNVIFTKQKNGKLFEIESICKQQVKCDSNLEPIAQFVVYRLENRRLLVRSTACPIFYTRIDDSHCKTIHSSLTTVHCFNDSYVGKQPVAWKEYCAEFLLTLSQTIPGFYMSAEQVY